MIIRSLAKSAALAVVPLSSVAVGSHIPGFTDTVWAKGGNGNGNGGGNGGGGNGASNGRGADRSSSRNESARSSARDLAPGESDRNAFRRTERRADKASLSRSELEGLNSLNRNYQANLNGNDPRMQAVSAYATD
jgi:hypothetical protein